MAMIIHEREPGLRGAGRWDLGTTRYVPISGGSRSRLPVYDDKNYRRYPGFVGMSEGLTESLHTLAALYQFLGGAPVILEGEGAAYTKLILDQTQDKIRKDIEDAEKLKKLQAVGQADD